jgi:CRP-like cAMP-binding protein
MTAAETGNMNFNFFKRNAIPPQHERLQALFLFRGLTARELDIVAGLLHEREYLADEIVFDEGETGHAVYIIVSGHALIQRMGAQTYETESLLADLGPGNSFGELALLFDTPRSAQVRAGSDCTMLVFFRDDFNELMQTHAVLAAKLGINLARHLGRCLLQTPQTAVGQRAEPVL